MTLLGDSERDIQIAARAIREGRLVAFPTETVYGLGADACNTGALARIFEAKGRPHFDPLIVHIADLGKIGQIACFSPPSARERLDLLARAFWPGPLTVVLPKKPLIPDLATAGLPTVALRFPRHRTALRLIELSTGAVAAPSANLFGCLSPTTAGHVAAQLGGRIDFIIDGGKAEVGVESTVLDLCSEKPRMLRPGGVSGEEISALIGDLDSADENNEDPSPSPGRLKSHYAPHTPLFLYPSLAALTPEAGDVLVFFDGKSMDGWLRQNAGNAPAMRVLSEAGSLRDAAARLFGLLHELDGAGFAAIRVERAPDTGLGAAINDRLCRAAAKQAI
jgi:L-threonylcarbamoyladenylate synthase